MKLNKKIILFSIMALTNVSLAVTHVAQATNITTKTIMHTAWAYDRSGNNTGNKYYAYKSVNVKSKPVTIDSIFYYKISGKNQYLKATNIDGVKRKITHNTYIYSTSKRRTSYNGRWKLHKGETIITYGGSYKFKNGKRYFRIGGPDKQYVKVNNLSAVIGSTDKNSSSVDSKNYQETTVTFTGKNGLRIFDGDGNFVKTKVKVGDKYVVDRLEDGSRAQLIEGVTGQFTGDPMIYRIKGTDHWIYAIDVAAKKKLPVVNYDLENYSLITFPKDTEVYNSDGTLQDHNGQIISQQAGHIKVDKLMYIWIPDKNKADLFYHLVGHSFYATGKGGDQDRINVGSNAYVKANDVKFIEQSKKLTPSNTLEEAKAAYEVNQTSNK